MAAPISFDNFILGGLADSPYFGGENSLAEIVGFDLHSQPGKAIVNQKLTKNSGDTVTEFCKVRAPLSDGSSVWFSSTTGKVWRRTSAGVWSLLGTIEFPALDIRTATDAQKSDDISAQVSSVQRIQLSADGTKMYVMDFLNNLDQSIIYQYSLSTAFDVSTSTYATKNIQVQAQAATGVSFFIKNDGLSMYVLDITGDVYKYTLSTAWDISTATYATQTFNAAAQDSNFVDLFFSDDGTKMFISGNTNNSIYEYTLSTAWDVSSATYVDAFDLDVISTDHISFTMSPDGLSVYVTRATNSGTVDQLNLGTAWDISTAAYNSVSFNVGSGRYYAIALAANESGLYLGTQSTPESVFQYSFADADANVVVLGAEEHDDKLYLATKNKLLSIAITSITSLTTGYVTAGNFTNGDDTYHPMKRLNGILYCGDGNLVSQVEDNVFTPNALDIVSPLRISALGGYDVELLIGTYVSSNIMQTHMIRWNTWSDSWQFADPIPEPGINAFLDVDNDVVVSAGTKGHIYTYNGVQLVSRKRLPGSFTRGTTDQCRVWHDSVLNFEGVALFGVSQVVGNSIKYGLYSYARRSAGYPFIFALEYVISANTLEDVEIGGIVSTDNGFLVAWKNGANVGVDLLDSANKYSGAYMTTRFIIADRREQTNLGQCDVAYALLPDGTDISISKKFDEDADFTEVVSVKDAKRLLKSTKSDLGHCVRGQVKIATTATGNNAPEIEGFYIDPK